MKWWVSPEVDILHVCTLDHLHDPIASASLAVGNYFYGEKTLTRTVVEAKNLHASARASGRVAQTAFQMRFGSGVHAAR